MTFSFGSHAVGDTSELDIARDVPGHPVGLTMLSELRLREVTYLT